MLLCCECDYFFHQLKSEFPQIVHIFYTTFWAWGSHPRQGRSISFVLLLFIFTFSVKFLFNLNLFLLISNLYDKILKKCLILIFEWRISKLKEKGQTTFSLPRHRTICVENVKNHRKIWHYCILAYYCIGERMLPFWSLECSKSSKILLEWQIEQKSLPKFCKLDSTRLWLVLWSSIWF